PTGPRPPAIWTPPSNTPPRLFTIAAPRGLMPAHCAALAARARIRAAPAAAAGADPDLLFQGRDADDAALRLAARHHLPWNELDALRAHAALDNAEGVARGWTAKADALYARLVPPDLDPTRWPQWSVLLPSRRPPTLTRRGARTGKHGVALAGNGLRCNRIETGSQLRP